MTYTPADDDVEAVVDVVKANVPVTFQVETTPQALLNIGKAVSAYMVLATARDSLAAVEAVTVLMEAAAHDRTVMTEEVSDEIQNFVDAIILSIGGDNALTAIHEAAAV